MSQVKFNFSTQVLVTDDCVQISACYSESFCSLFKKKKKIEDLT